MDNQFKLRDLKLILKAIITVREVWLTAIDSKYREIQANNPSLDRKEALNQAMVHPEVHETFKPLINLYGIIGGDAATYEQALNLVVELETNVLPFKRTA